MWRHWPLLVLLASVPLQYWISKYLNWVGSSVGEFVPPSESPYSTPSSSNYYLQKAFASLDKRLKLRQWSRWSEDLVQCAKRFIFDYMGSEKLADDKEEASSEQIARDGDSSSKSQASKEYAAVEKGSHEKTGKTVKEIIEYDENEHFASSREPRSPRNPQVLYRVGQVFRHKKYKHRGVITGWDVRPKLPTKLAESIFRGEAEKTKDEPFYAALIDTRDRVSPQMDYLAQQFIEILPATTIIHPLIHEYFESLKPDPATGRYKMRPYHKAVYPED